jgi:hypothetical protein
MRSLDSLAAHPVALAGFARRLWIRSLLTRVRSLDSLGASGFSRCSPGCARWILSAPLDSLAAHPDALAEFSPLLWILWLLTGMRSLDSLGASGFSPCSPGCVYWMHSAPLDSLAAHPDALAGFTRRLWILSLLTPRRSLDFLCSSGFSSCPPGCTHWILSLLTSRRSVDSLGASRFSRCSPGWVRWIHSAPLDPLAAHQDALTAFARRL